MSQDEPEAAGPEPRSPCVSVCLFDFERGLCQGCLRTLEEIQEWSVASRERKREILDDLNARRGERV